VGGPRTPGGDRLRYPEDGGPSRFHTGDLQALPAPEPPRDAEIDDLEARSPPRTSPPPRRQIEGNEMNIAVTPMAPPPAQSSKWTL
jgi:hypothetical protein